MNPACHVVTDSDWNAAFLRRVLRTEESAALVRVTRSASVVSTARTILLARRVPVVLVVDARSTSPDAVAERRNFLEVEMKAARTDVPAEVILAVPGLGVCLFDDPGLLPALGIATISESERVQARFQPNVILNDRLQALTPSVTPEEWLARLPDDAVESLRQTPIVRRILDSIARFEPATAAAAP